MQCPNCKVNFHPQLKCQFMGQNRTGLAVALYWQTCPSCDKFIVCLKESSNGNDVLGNPENFNSGMIIYPRSTSEQI